MKILTEEEIKGQRYYTLMGGLKGAAVGFVISALGFRYLPKRYPRFNPKNLTWSFKTAFFIMPPTVLTAIWAEEASNKFDAMTYGTGSESEEALEEQRRWQRLSTKDKLVESCSNNRYKIITGAWAASLWGSWALVNRDKIMTPAQKAVQARMYAQFITVALLLLSMGLSMYENKLHPDKQKKNDQRRWEKALAMAEEAEAADREGKTGFASNDERRKAKIFKYD